MNQYVTDTMALVSHLGKRKIPLHIKQLFIDADAGAIHVIVPTIVLVEIGYLSEKGRIDVSLQAVQKHFMLFPTYTEQPPTFDIVTESFKILDIPELHDRVIAGTAKFLDLPLITNDPIIRASSFVKTIW